jgi:hypothetical protein
MTKKVPSKGKTAKSVKKATMSKKAARPAKGPLTKASAEYVFWCQDGSTFSDLLELAEGLRMMSDETFAFHSNPEKHDFSNWIRDVLGEGELADELMMVSSRPEAVSCIIARISD